jgi:hypothetical protein
MAETGQPAVDELYRKAELSFRQALSELRTLRAGLGVGRLSADLGALEAGNTACDSGCDSGCGGALAASGDLKIQMQNRLAAVFDARRAAGIERIEIPAGSVEAAGNDACDSGCDGGCSGRFAGQLAGQNR